MKMLMTMALLSRDRGADEEPMRRRRGEREGRLAGRFVGCEHLTAAVLW